MAVNQDPKSATQEFQTMAPYRVLPVPDDETRPFWEGAKQHKLMIQRCQGCGFYNHPPVYLCAACKTAEAELKFEEVAGRGRLYAWIIQYDAATGGFEDKVPYAVASIELDAQPGLMLVGNIVGCYLGELAQNMHLEIVWEQTSEEIVIPQWRPTSG